MRAHHHDHEESEELGSGLIDRLRPLLKLVESQKRLLWLTVAVGALNQILIVILGALGAWVVGQAISGASWESIKPAAITIAVLIIPRAVLPWLDTLFAHLMAFRVLVVIRNSVIQAFVRLSPGGLLSSRSGDLGSRVIGDVELTEVFFAHTLPHMIVAATVPFVSLMLLAWCHWSLPLLLIPVAFLVILVPRLFQKRASREGNAVRSELGELSADITDRVQGLHEVTTFNAGQQSLDHISATESRLHKAQLAHVIRAGHERNLSDLALGLGVFCVMIAAASLVLNSAMPSALFPVAVTIAGLSLAPLAQIVDVARELNVVAAAAKRIANLVESEPVINEVETDSLGSVELDPSIEVNNISFTYENTEAKAIDGVSFKVEAGEMIALVGKSGAGKSTTAHLLMRYWDPESGVIKVGGHDLDSLAGDRRRELMTLVPQEVYLFHGTLRQNLVLGAPDSTDEQIQQALSDAAIADFVATLPQGLETLVGERGASLSGGQRQRIAMARAILANRPVLILDEPVAHLDAETERSMAQALERTRKGRTVVLIAHRLSTILLADRIVMLGNGRVLDSGTHQELLDEQGPYAALVAPQLEEFVQS